MSSDTDAQTRRIPGRGATRIAGEIRRGVVGTVVGVVAVLLVALLALFGLARLTHWPFGSEQRDRSGPAVLTAMRDLSEYHAAAGQYQVLIDIQQDAKFLPDVIKGKRTIFLAIGSVDAYVDFRKLGDDAVSVSADRKSVSMTLPRHSCPSPTSTRTRAGCSTRTSA